MAALVLAEPDNRRCGPDPECLAAARKDGRRGSCAGRRRRLREWRARVAQMAGVTESAAGRSNRTLTDELAECCRAGVALASGYSLYAAATSLRQGTCVPRAALDRLCARVRYRASSPPDTCRASDLRLPTRSRPFRCEEPIRLSGWAALSAAAAQEARTGSKRVAIRTRGPGLSRFSRLKAPKPRWPVCRRPVVVSGGAVGFTAENFRFSKSSRIADASAGASRCCGRRATRPRLACRATARSFAPQLYLAIGISGLYPALA